MRNQPTPVTRLMSILSTTVILLLTGPAQAQPPRVQSMLEVAKKTDETARLLAQAMMKEGQFKSISDAQKEDLLAILSGIQTAKDREDLPNRLQVARRGFNGSGGGGGIACFTQQSESSSALDQAGRMKREALDKIADFDNFDTFRIVHGDERRWQDALNGNFHLRTPLKGEGAEFFLRRILYQNALAFFPLLVERLMAVMMRYPFATWQPISGLPFYPDLDRSLFEDLRSKDSTCVYTQIVIRTAKSTEQVQYFYDKELLSRVRELSESEEDYQRRLATLILHEDLYLLAREMGAVNANEIHDIEELVLFDDPDVERIKNAYFQPANLQIKAFDQSVDQLFAQPYETLLAQEPSIAPWPSKLELYQAWSKTMKREIELEKEQESKTCDTQTCMAAGGLYWRHLFENPAEAAALTPTEIYFALTPSLNAKNEIPSPEALVSRSVDPRGALTYSCGQIDFEQETFTMSQLNTHAKLKLDPNVGRMIFKKLKEFCQPAL